MQTPSSSSLGKLFLAALPSFDPPISINANPPASGESTSPTAHTISHRAQRRKCADIEEDVIKHFPRSLQTRAITNRFLEQLCDIASLTQPRPIYPATAQLGVWWYPLWFGCETLTDRQADSWLLCAPSAFSSHSFSCFLLPAAAKLAADKLH